jgi:hypothetical protein
MGDRHGDQRARRARELSNAIDHAIVVCRERVAGLGDAARFEPGDEEILSFCFDVPQRDAVARRSSAASPACRTAARCRRPQHGSPRDGTGENR